MTPNYTPWSWYQKGMLSTPLLSVVLLHKLRIF